LCRVFFIDPNKYIHMSTTAIIVIVVFVGIVVGHKLLSK
jgi:hypothetical protein